MHHESYIRIMYEYRIRNHHIVLFTTRISGFLGYRGLFGLQIDQYIDLEKYKQVGTFYTIPSYRKNADKKQRSCQPRNHIRLPTALDPYLRSTPPSASDNGIRTHPSGGVISFPWKANSASSSACNGAPFRNDTRMKPCFLSSEGK